MKKTMFIAILALGLVLMSMPAAFAIELGTNITIYDGSTHGSNSWYGTQEDNEVEWRSVANQSWDLEGMFLKGTTLSLVGGWDFVSGHSGAGGDYDSDSDGLYTSGDVFIDVDGVDYGTAYGYDYAFDVDWGTGTYNLMKLSSSSTYLETTYVSSSNPWKYKDGGTQVGSSGTFKTTALTANEAAALGLMGYDGNDDHNVVSFDLLPILDNLNVSKIDFTAHFTMECGNDNLMGQGTAPVPEPQTLLLMGIGLLGLAFIGRKKLGDRS